MIRDAKIQAAYYGVRALPKERPSVRDVVSMYRKMYGGIRSDDVRAWLSGEHGRDTVGTHSGYIAGVGPDTQSPRKTRDSDTLGTQDHQDSGYIAPALESLLESIIPPEKDPTGPSLPPKRRRISPVRHDDAFGELEPLVLEVLGNNAAQRRDGKMADTVIDKLRQRLARARVQHGVEAVRLGLQIAADKGFGIEYACGCAKNHHGAEPATPQEPEREVFWQHGA